MVEEMCLTEALLEGAKEVFETMIFMDLTECGDEEFHIEGDALMGTITFQKSLEGCLGVCCGMKCAGSIAANMLGLEPGDEVSEEDVCDAIGEVVNMVMGSVKTRLLEVVDDIQAAGDVFADRFALTQRIHGEFQKHGHRLILLAAGRRLLAHRPGRVICRRVRHRCIAFFPPYQGGTCLAWVRVRRVAWAGSRAEGERICPWSVGRRRA